MIHTKQVYQAAPYCYVPAPFQVSPHIALTGKKTVFHLKIEAGYLPVSRWEITKLEAISDNGVLPNGETGNIDEFAEVPFRIENDELIFESLFPAEGPYFFRILCGAREAMSFRLYALNDDLYGLLPLKGDTHLHSFYSDGHQDPQLTAIRGRRRGNDFLAITDHQVYEGSTHAMTALKDSGTGLLQCPGEELHLPLREDFIRPYKAEWLAKLPWVSRALAAHFINFGGSFSVNDYAYSDLPRYYREVAEYEKTMPATLSPSDRFCCAAAEWAFDKIHEGGGLAVYPHPYWAPGSRRAVTEAMHQVLMTRGKFDAFETVNSTCQYDYNMMAMSEYSRQCSLGRNYAVLGGSDGHNADQDENWAFSVVFAKELTKDGIIEAVRARRSCSVMPEDNRPPIVTGELRLVRLVYFLLKSYFPMHDKYCALEGSLLEAAYQRQSSVLAQAVPAAAEQVKALRESIYKR